MSTTSRGSYFTVFHITNIDLVESTYNQSSARPLIFFKTCLDIIFRQRACIHTRLCGWVGRQKTFFAPSMRSLRWMRSMKPTFVLQHETKINNRRLSWAMPRSDLKMVHEKEDNHKNEDDPKNEDDLKNEDKLKN